MGRDILSFSVIRMIVKGGWLVGWGEDYIERDG